MWCSWLMLLHMCVSTAGDEKDEEEEAEEEEEEVEVKKKVRIADEVDVAPAGAAAPAADLEDEEVRLFSIRVRKFEILKSDWSTSRKLVCVRRAGFLCRMRKSTKYKEEYYRGT